MGNMSSNIHAYIRTISDVISLTESMENVCVHFVCVYFVCMCTAVIHMCMYVYRVSYNVSVNKL